MLALIRLYNQKLLALTIERENMAGNGLEALGGPNGTKSANLFLYNMLFQAKKI